MLVQAAITRYDVSNYIGALFEVYIILILLYVLINLVLGFGARPPYSRAFDVLMTFLRDVSEPLLRVFRRVLPSMAGVDLSPMAAIFSLYILDRVITSLITG